MKRRGIDLHFTKRDTLEFRDSICALFGRNRSVRGYGIRLAVCGVVWEVLEIRNRFINRPANSMMVGGSSANRMNLHPERVIPGFAGHSPRTHYEEMDGVSGADLVSVEVG